MLPATLLLLPLLLALGDASTPVAETAPAPARTPVTPPALPRRPQAQLVPGEAEPTAPAPVVAAAHPTPAEADAALAPLAWLAGAWTDTDAGGQTEEHWLPPRGGLMLGVQRSVSRRSGRASFEYLRIEVGPAGPQYVAAPGGHGDTAFQLTTSAEGVAVFEKPEHDFPRRISYRLQDDGSLEVFADGGPAEPAKRLEWRLTRPAAAGPMAAEAAPTPTP